MADSEIEELIRHIDDVIQEAERVRQSVEQQLRRRPLWPPERGRLEEDPPDSDTDRQR